MQRALFLLLTLGSLSGGLLAAEPKVVFEDRFDGKLGEGWVWLRENPQAWRIRDNALEIRAEPGDANTVKNALVRPVPDRTQGRYAVEVKVTYTAAPTQQYEQAGLTWYQRGQPQFKLVKELVDGQIMMIPGRAPMPSQTVQLRLLAAGEKITLQFRPDGQGEFRSAATNLVTVAKDEQVSLQCYHGPTTGEHWMRFDDFRILELPKE